MKLMTKLLIIGSFSVILTACGGGSDSTTSLDSNTSGNTYQPANNPNIIANRDQNEGAVSQTFQADGDNALFFVYYPGTESSGPIQAASSLQNQAGAFTNINGKFQLTGDKIAVHHIAGDNNYAIGQWAYGTPIINNETQTALQDTYSYGTYLYYIVYNVYTDRTANHGSKDCQLLSATTPILTNGNMTNGNHYIAKVVDGSGHIHFNTPSEATFDIQLTLNNGKEQSSFTYQLGDPATLSSNSGIISGAKTTDPSNPNLYLSNGQYTTKFAKGATADEIRMISIFNTGSQNFGYYKGIAVFSCK